MHRMHSCALLAAGLLLSASVVQAGTLTSASLTIAVGTLPPVTFTATGIVGAGGALGNALWNVGAGAVPGGTVTTTLPTSAFPPITALKLIVNGNPAAGAFAATSGGAMAVTGAANIKLSGITALKIPVSIGVPVTIEPPVATGIGITAFGNAWTTKTATVDLLPATFGPTVVTVMGANGLVGGAGTVVLVTALNVLTSIAGQLPTFGILTLNYAAPEPGLVIPLGAVAAGLVLLGRRRTRR